MIDERIDIQITDKISNQPAKKLRDLAAAALEADTALKSLNKINSVLDGSAVNRMSAAAKQLSSATTKLAKENMEAASSVDQLRAKYNPIFKVLSQYKNTLGGIKSAHKQGAISADEMTAAIKRERTAALDSIAAIKGRSNAISNSSRQIRQQAAQTQNLIFQVQDIAVGLQAGQKPLTVLLQQGTQIAGAFGPGTGVTGIIGGLVKAIGTMVRPFVPIIAIVGAISGGFGVLLKEVRGVTDVAVTFGDVVKGSIVLAYNTIKELLTPAITSIDTAFTKTYDFILKYSKITINGIVGSFVFAKDAIITTWELLPSAIGSVVINSANATIASIEAMTNGVISLLNSLVDQANKISEIVGISLSNLGEVSINRINNSYAGAGERLGKELAEAANQAFNQDYTGQAFTAITNKSVEIANKRLAEEAKKNSTVNKELTAKEKILQDILQPLVEYEKTTKAINELLTEGVISIGQYNEALNSLSLVEGLRAVDSTLTGSFSDNGLIEELRVAQQERLNVVQTALDARIINEKEAMERVVAINRQAALDIQNIEATRNSILLTSSKNTFDSLAQVAKGFAGEQSGVFKALFVASKAFAIADSIIKIQQGIANAIALPFPANISAAATVAAAAANIVSSIQAVQFANGGKVTGPGGPRDDKIVARLSAGEFVVNADAAKRNLPLLEAINNNQAAIAPAYRDGGSVQQAYRPSINETTGNNSRNNSTNNTNNLSFNIVTRDPETRVEMSSAQIATAEARKVQYGQRNL